MQIQLEILLIFILVCFSQQMRFNKKGDFNMPFGNGAFTKDNENYIKNGCNYFSQLNVEVSNNHFPMGGGRKVVTLYI